jgi:hypothetical protein
VLPEAAGDQPGWSASSPAQAQPGSPMAAAWVTGFAEPNGSGGSNGVTGSAPGRPVNGTAAGGTYLGMPRRVRQASLAPQLRGGPGAEPGASLLHPESSGRSPEQTSSRLSALQDGWLRGRLDDLDSLGADPSEPDLGGRPEDTSGG